MKMGDEDQEKNKTGKRGSLQTLPSLDLRPGREEVPVGDDGPPANVVSLCRDTFQKTADYLRGELEGTAEDYKLLEKMNKVTLTKYSEMKHIALNVATALQELNEKYVSLQPYLDQIDQIEESVAGLEQAAYNLDQYSKRLEEKFKSLEKR
ncbi:biogenesis of lysosome-related organelles complex 1 subunit 2-like [Gigantopelta aegis]|uniref:biogenesis of lysosome-related organelles complex 1 subunit 2-like n=1 Tax=Gigantopelta aegis TaxID=1735272 RepID=UPI001B88B85F|nr:biogenesis of lysosome-related organelles complex 1 subunit 2-like [Gigantopelta aegis]